MRSYLRVTGEILVTIGVVAVLFLAYMFWGTAAKEGAAQRHFTTQLGREWAGAGSDLALLSDVGQPRLGQPFAIMRIPALGRSWHFAIVQGTGLAQLALGPGHVPGTAWPGQVGNFAVAGHRVTAGNPFWGGPHLKRGDMIYVETAAATLDYRVTGPPVWVSPTDTAMLAPVPGNPDRAPTRALMTLITCGPAWTGTSRVIVTAALTKEVKARCTASSGGGCQAAG